VEGDVAALLDLEAADDVVRVDVLAGVSPHLLVADRLQIVLVQEVEAELLRLGGAEHPYGHADEAERDRAAPDRACHAVVVPPFCARENGRVWVSGPRGTYEFKGGRMLFQKLL